jgi:hypothetical protein
VGFKEQYAPEAMPNFETVDLDAPPMVQRDMAMTLSTKGRISKIMQSQDIEIQTGPREGYGAQNLLLPNLQGGDSMDISDNYQVQQATQALLHMVQECRSKAVGVIQKWYN